MIVYMYIDSSDQERSGRIYPPDNYALAGPIHRPQYAHLEAVNGRLCFLRPAAPRD
ncbi:Hypothetical protein FKW44_023656 [Caligus rogercresseyi]|uniref:Uncharacterized protein n=1 Tax=Caligus rogercresseyi TaxID=217165 RepID=A0A7T8GPA5_CALRO|nr:Hypothetical protein FKW44_023656 [Caligus rogercresseyi]